VYRNITDQTEKTTQVYRNITVQTEKTTQVYRNITDHTNKTTQVYRNITDHTDKTTQVYRNITFFCLVCNVSGGYIGIGTVLCSVSMETQHFDIFYL
jgi:site-specific DNA-adenine methylase